MDSGQVSPGQQSVMPASPRHGGVANVGTCRVNDAPHFVIDALWLWFPARQLAQLVSGHYRLTSRFVDMISNVLGYSMGTVREGRLIERSQISQRGPDHGSEAGHRVRDPEQTLQRLLEAALVVFGRHGYERATVDEIVHVAGCSKGAFYNHFASKEELFLLLLERRVSGNADRLMTVCQWEGDAAQWLRKVFDTIVSFGRHEPNWRALSVEFMAHGMRDARIGRSIASMHRQARELIATPLRESEEFHSGRMIVDPDMVATCMVALIDGLLIHASMEPDEMPVQQLGRRLEPLLRLWFPKQ